VHTAGSTVRAAGDPDCVVPGDVRNLWEMWPRTDMARTIPGEDAWSPTTGTCRGAAGEQTWRRRREALRGPVRRRRMPWAEARPTSCSWEVVERGFGCAASDAAWGGIPVSHQADTIAKASARAPRGVLARSHHQRRTQSIGIGTLLFGADPARAILSSPPDVHTALSQSITTDGLIRFWTRVWLGKVSPWSRWRSRPSMCWCEHPITWEWRSRER
jgi:hypothetical protein